MNFINRKNFNHFLGVQLHYMISSLLFESPQIMERQFNVSVCLKELRKSMQSIILEGKLYTHLLRKFTREEIEQELPKQQAIFLESIDGPAAEQARQFCQNFCRNITILQRNDVIDMVKFEQRINDFQKKYEESKQKIDQRVMFTCKKCKTSYSTENGLYNHLTRKNCSIILRKRRMNKRGIKGPRKYGKRIKKR